MTARPAAGSRADAVLCGGHRDAAVLAQARFEIGQPAGSPVGILDLVAIPRSKKNAQGAVRQNRRGCPLKEWTSFVKSLAVELNEGSASVPVVVTPVAHHAGVGKAERPHLAV